RSAYISVFCATSELVGAEHIQIHGPFLISFFTSSYIFSTHNVKSYNLDPKSSAPSSGGHGALTFNAIDCGEKKPYLPNDSPMQSVTIVKIHGRREPSMIQSHVSTTTVCTKNQAPKSPVSS